MGSLFLTDLADYYRFFGAPIREVAGWQTRARGSGGFPNGRVECLWGHHTASGPASDGWPSVNYGTFNAPAKPIANMYLDRTGLLWLTAGGAANTEGAGGPLFGIAKDNANAVSWAIEVMNNGVGEPYPDVQQQRFLDACVIFSMYCIQKGWWTLDELLHRRHGTHFEWAPTRKIDLRGPSRWNGGGAQVKWDYNAFRRDVHGAVAYLLNPAPVEPPPPDPPPPSGEHLPWVPIDPARQDGVWPDMVQREQGHRVVQVQFCLVVNQKSDIPCDGDYGPKTSDHVRWWQVTHGLPNTGNVDYLTARSLGFNAEPVPPPPPVPTPTPEPPPQADTWIEPNPFFYLWSGARWSYTVAKTVWGNGNAYPHLDAANNPWPASGQHVKIPNVVGLPWMPGAGALVRPGDGPLAIIKRIWPDANPMDRLETFYKWNGGKDRALRPGDRVFIPA